jgi:hypothetical protein
MLFVLDQPRNETDQERPIPSLEHLEQRPHLLTCGTHPFRPAQGGASSPTLARGGGSGRRREATARHDHHLDGDDDVIPFDLHAPAPFLAKGDRDTELATKRRREVAAWWREVTEWRRDTSSTANTPFPASTSSAAFSPVSSRVLSSPIPMG